METTKIKKLLDTLISLDGIKSQNDLNTLKSIISNCIKFLPPFITLQNYNDINNRETIDEFLYGKIIGELLQLMNHDNSYYDKNLENLIETLIVVNGSTFKMLYETLEILSDCLKSMKNDKIINLIVTLLDKIVKSDAIYSAIVSASKPNLMNSMEEEEFLQNWREFLQILVSLPNRIANKMAGKINDTFTPNTYTNIIAYHIIRAISFLNDVIHEYSIEPKYKIISTIISKIVLTLGAMKFVNLIEILIAWALNEKKNIWNFIRNILCQIDRLSIEPIAVLFLKKIKTPSVMQKIFQDLLKIDQWKHVFITKIPLMSYYNDELLIINLIYYLAHHENDKRILIDLLIRLLDIWGDRSALNHTSLEQHEYITKLILLSVKKLKNILMKKDKDIIQRLLFEGTAAHLESMQVEVRAIGMITGELIVEFLMESNDAPRLEYEYDSMPTMGIEIVERMKTFIKNTDEENLQHINDNENNSSDNEKIFTNNEDKKIQQLGIECGILPEDDKKNIKIKENIRTTLEILEKSKLSDDNESSINTDEKNDNDDLDSDDDLIPYDMSNDTKISEKLRPSYLRDLKENLLNVDANKDPDIFSESLTIAEELILSQLPNDDVSLGIELLRILTGLRETVYVENFELLKFRSCVAIVTVYPKQSAIYLCTEFHAEIGTHSVNDRMLFLDILAEAAKQLSKIEIKPNINENVNFNSDNKQIKKLKKPSLKSNKKVSLFIDVSGGKKYETLYDEDFEVSTIDNNTKQSDWEDIVQQRIQSNTRIFAHQSKNTPMTMNKFNDVVSSFFYPLLYGLSQKSACLYKIPQSYEDQENILLVQFLKTLSIIMVSAENCVIAPKIGLEILELAWTLRYHEQAKVRLCVIQNIASVIISISKDTLTNEIIDLLLEFRIWLFDISKDSVRGDPDKYCRSLGQNVVALIDSMLNATINEK